MKTPILSCVAIFLMSVSAINMRHFSADERCWCSDELDGLQCQIKALKQELSSEISKLKSQNDYMAQEIQALLAEN
jgi:hypothetical protein